ncbi:MAG TPA: glycosyltransferase family 1 protein, partial [Chitinophagaceae bacterium]|nr:glycosyltransferase family 1 protein [Chitinophagaceae bacterium]
YILFVGRLNSRKNIQGLVRSLSLIDNKNILLVIAGDRNWKQPAVDHLLADERIKDRILFTGPLSDDHLAAIYAMAKIFCFPSFAEGFGLPPLEAMSSGVPVIVSNTTSMPEVCGTAALFADPHDPKNIAKKIDELLQNDELCAQKILEGLKWSCQYTWRGCAEGIMKAILSAVEIDVK